MGPDEKLFRTFLRGEGCDFWSDVAQLNVNTSKSWQYNIFVPKADLEIM